MSIEDDLPSSFFITGFSFVRINIFQASLTDSYHIGVFKPEIILRIFLFFDQVRKQNVKLVFQCTMARSQPQYDSQIILNIPRFEPHDSYKKYSYKKKKRVIHETCQSQLVYDKLT